MTKKFCRTYVLFTLWRLRKINIKITLKNPWKWWKELKNNSRTSKRFISTASRDRNRKFLVGNGKNICKQWNFKKKCGQKLLIRVIAENLLHCLRIAFLHKWVLWLNFLKKFVHIIDNAKIYDWLCSTWT